MTDETSPRPEGPFLAGTRLADAHREFVLALASIERGTKVHDLLPVEEADLILASVRGFVGEEPDLYQNRNPKDESDDLTTVHLLADERKTVRDLSDSMEISPKAVIRQALALLQLTQRRIQAGETQHWSGDAQRAADFSGIPVEGEETYPVLDELARRLFTHANPFRKWSMQSGTERNKWRTMAKEALKPAADDKPPSLSNDAALVRQAYIDGAESVLATVESVRLHVSLGPKATFSDGMETMKGAIVSAAQSSVRAMKGEKL